MKIGDNVGNLTITDIRPGSNGKGFRCWCECVCGKRFSISQSELLRGKRKSCGALGCWRPLNWGEQRQGGRRVTKDGYAVRITNGIERAEHRIFMERHLNRPLLESEVVHHINGDRQDNRIENLCVMDLQQHSRKHANQSKQIAILLSENKRLRKENEQLRRARK